MNTQERDYVMIPATDIYETPESYNLTVEMPGVTKENLEITVQENELEIKGHISDEKGEHDYSEFSLNNFYQKFKIGNDIDRNNVKATLSDGVLELSLQKAEEVKPKKIEISVH